MIKIVNIIMIINGETTFVLIVNANYIYLQGQRGIIR